MMSSLKLQRSLSVASRAVRWTLVGKLGRICHRVRGETGRREFFLDFRPHGRVWSNRGIAITDEETARRLIEQIRGLVAEGATLEAVLARYQPTTAKASSVAAWLPRWLEVRRRECAAGSLSPNYLAELERLAGADGYFSFFADKSIHEISFGTLEDFSLWLADRDLAPKSRRNYLAAFQAFLKWLKRRGEIRDVPELALPKCDEHEPRLLAISDQDCVLAAIPEEDRGIFLALAHLGLRPGEARAVIASDYQGGWLHVSRAFKGKSVTSPIRGTKTGKPKRLPVSEELRAWIEARMKPEDRLRQRSLFPNPRTGQPWPHKALQRVWSEALETAELPHISLYEGTKHSFATDAIRRGVPERHLQRFLGHASIQSTRRYARLADNALVEVLRTPARVADGAKTTKSGSAKPSAKQRIGDKVATRVPRTKPNNSAGLRVGPPGFEPGSLRL